jgi:hypothetical protein
MNRNTKIVLAVAVLVVATVCLLATMLVSTGLKTARAAAQMFPTDAQDLAVTGDRIVDYQLPAGFEEDYAVNVGGISVAAFVSRDGHGHLFVAQFPEDSELTLPVLESDIRRAVPDQENGASGLLDVQELDRVETMICGQPVTLTVSESSGTDGRSYRQVNGVFQGKSGPTLISLAAPVQNWNQVELDRFLASMRCSTGGE